MDVKPFFVTQGDRDDGSNLKFSTPSALPIVPSFEIARRNSSIIRAGTSIMSEAQPGVGRSNSTLHEKLLQMQEVLKSE